MSWYHAAIVGPYGVALAGLLIYLGVVILIGRFLGRVSGRYPEADVAGQVDGGELASIRRGMSR